MDSIDVSAFCKTKAQAHDFATRLGLIAQQVYQTDFNAEKVFLTHLGIQKTDAFITLLRENNISTTNGGELKAFLSKLQEQVIALPVLTLVIAIEPTEATLKLLSEWFLMNVKKQMLFDITVDPSLVAGITVSFGGKHAEYSIQPQVIEVIKQVIQSTAQPPQAPPHPVKPQVGHQSIEHITLGR